MQKMQQAEAQPVVFVVDDDASVRGALSNLIRSVGLQAEVFTSTSEFLSGKRPNVPSCLILDVRLPGVSGNNVFLNCGLGDLDRSRSAFLSDGARRRCAIGPHTCRIIDSSQ